jgi:twitching motility protein PilT
MRDSAASRDSGDEGYHRGGDAMRITGLLQEALQRDASDLHIVAGIPPSLRVDGEIIFMDHDALSHEDTREMIYGILTEEQKAAFEKEWELEFSYAVGDIGRFRASVYYERGHVEASFRIVPMGIKSLQELGLPEEAGELALKPNGLVLITGPTGSGKTTTLNAMIDRINREHRCRIITIEDPVEYLHEHKRSVIIQREVGTDTRSFYEALIHSLRQDPNVICIGEMRDLETISTVLTAAETGHLVISTLHTSDAVQTVERIVDVFPPHQQVQVRMQLASSLQGIISQQLLPKVAERGRVVAVELLIATPAVRHLIREGKAEQIQNVLHTGKEFGMVAMDRSLRTLYEVGIITYDTALSRVRDADTFKRL